MRPNAVVVLAAVGAAGLLLVLPQGNGLAQARGPETCAHLPDPPGKAKGIERRCAVGASAGVARADFNGDGFGDLAVAAPYEDIGSDKNAGAVWVFYGSASGLQAPTSGGATPPVQLWTQDSGGVPGASENDDNFGMALAAGDLNNDGTSDLAIGAPGEGVNLDGDGSVTIVYGSSGGLIATSSTTPQPTLLTLRSGVGPAICLCYTHSNIEAGFGSSLAWGDFDGDGANDLAVAAPDTRLVHTLGGGAIDNAGLVEIVYGAPGTPMTNGSAKGQLWQPPPPPFESGDQFAEPYDEFGSTLTAGTLDSGNRTDLVIGVPSEDVGSIAGAGMIHVVYGCAARFDCTQTRVTQATAGVPGVAEAGDFFGGALTTGDFDGDGRGDLAVGVPNENVGSVVNAGAVEVFNGAAGGITLADAQLWTQDGVFGSSPDPFQGSPSETDDYFGSSLAAADFNGDGRKDLAIGVPYENVFTNRTGSPMTVADAGEVDVLYGSTSGLSKAAVRIPQMWHQDVINIEGDVAPGDRFGSSLSAWNFGGAGTTADLGIGVPFENLGPLGGAVAVIYSSSTGNGLASAADQIWHQDSPNVPGESEDGDRFGWGMY